MRKFCKVMSVILLVLFIIMIPVNVVVRMFDNTIALLVAGNKFWELKNKDDNAIYFSGDYSSEAERLAAGNELCYQVEAEGAALLLNNGALPLAQGAKVSTLSTNSVNLTYGGTGSGNVDASKADNLKAALEKSGFLVNGTLWDWYGSKDAQKILKDMEKESGKSQGESAVLAGQAPILEIDIDKYPEDVKNSIPQYGDAVIITFSRVGGEGYDCSFPGYKGEANAQNYLELDARERKLLEYANGLKDAGEIKNIIVLINTSNALEVDFLKDYDVDACLWVGGLGISGTNAVTDILAGKVNPSGSLVDTYCYDNFTSPAMQNFIAQTYLFEEGTELNEKDKMYVLPDGTIVPVATSTYMVYQEGIYVGYKYYETRYADAVMGVGNAGNYATEYSNEVAFPFGHGLSYTNFSYSDMKVEKGVNEDGEACYNVSVKVTNNGSVAGKETVQIYLSSPYTQYDIDHKIEKAAVQLIGFGKTSVLGAGAFETITIQVDERDMAAYDAYGAGTYILDAGTYYLTAATDSHNAVNNVLAAKGYTTDDGMDADGNSALVHAWDMEFDAETYSTSLNGTKIENQLSGSDPNLYYGENTVTFLSRNDWNGTWPTGDYKLLLSAKMANELDNRYENKLPEYEQMIADFEAKTGRDWNTMPLLGQDGELSLYDMFTADYDNNGVAAYQQYNDPAWDKLLEQVTMEELITIGDCFHWRHPVASVNAPGSRDENGPQGLTVSLFGSGLNAEATAFTSEDVMAATFNTELMYQVGVMIGNDCIDAGVSCLYGPGANTHRTPYGGRNFEYYSEDGFLAGEMGGAEVSGILSKGVDVVMKHFALNDSEQERLGQAAWLTEQAAREIYLKAFQKALEENDGRGGVMTAYTRWGTTWSAANYGLMTGILREEWGNNSMHITDNMITPNCNAIDAIMAGGVTCFDAMMNYATSDIKTATDDPVFVNAMVEATHHNLYTIINSAAMNGVGPETTVKATQPAIINTITIATVVLGILGIGGCVVFRKKY